ILGHEQDLELAQKGVAPGDERVQLFLSQLPHIGIAARLKLFGLPDVARDRFVLAKALHDRLEARQRLGLPPLYTRRAPTRGRAAAAARRIGVLLRSTCRT